MHSVKYMFMKCVDRVKNSIYQCFAVGGNELKKRRMMEMGTKDDTNERRRRKRLMK